MTSRRPDEMDHFRGDLSSLADCDDDNGDKVPGMLFKLSRLNFKKKIEPFSTF